MAKKILIIDDDTQIVNVLKRQLVPNGYNVVTAPNGADGLDMAKKEKPDLILLDRGMPVIDGETLCKLLKSDPKTGSIKIIMLSGDKLMGDMEDSFNAGAEAYLTKPYDLLNLLAHVKKLIG
jgi:CheY-like chemotaxis protein